MNEEKENSNSIYPIYSSSSSAWSNCLEEITSFYWSMQYNLLEFLTLRQRWASEPEGLCCSRCCLSLFWLISFSFPIVFRLVFSLYLQFRSSSYQFTNSYGNEREIIITIGNVDSAQTFYPCRRYVNLTLVILLVVNVYKSRLKILFSKGC